MNHDRSRRLAPGEELVALLRAGHILVHAHSEEELVRAILDDAVSTLDAQRGAVVLAVAPTGPLKIRALAGRQSQIPSQPGFCQTLANRSFLNDVSLLYSSGDADPELAGDPIIAAGSMASVLCVVLRTPSKVLGVLHLDRGPNQKPFIKDDLYFAEALGANLAAGLENSQLLESRRNDLRATISFMCQAIELRDLYTWGHVVRTTHYAVILAEQAGMTGEELGLLRIGAPLHDIGIIGLADAILRKPGKLTRDEFERIKRHTLTGAKILEAVPNFAPVIPIVRSHHERWDGRGYPEELEGEAIPVLARIVSIADAFDAMTSDSHYRQPFSSDIAFAEIERQNASQFDPELVTCFLKARNKIVEKMRSAE